MLITPFNRFRRSIIYRRSQSINFEISRNQFIKFKMLIILFNRFRRSIIYRRRWSKTQFKKKKF